MGSAELDLIHDKITIYSHLVTYGNSATAELTEQIREEIETMWNEPMAFMSYDDKELLTMSAKEVEFIKEYDASQWWFLEHTYLYMLLAIPLCTTFCYFFFRMFKRRYNFAENAVIVMFTIAQGVLVQSVLYLLTGWVKNGVFIRSMEMVNLVLMLSVAIYCFYQIINPAKNKIVAKISTFFASTIVLLIMLASAYLLMWMSKMI